MSEPEDKAGQGPPPARFIFPAMRTFVVRKKNWNYMGGEDKEGNYETIETTVEAHVCQFSEPDLVIFQDYVRDVNTGLALQIHRIFYHVEDVEEVLREKTAIQPPSRILH